MAASTSAISSVSDNKNEIVKHYKDSESSSIGSEKTTSEPNVSLEEVTLLPDPSTSNGERPSQICGRDA